MAVKKNYRSILLQDGFYALSQALAQKKRIFPAAFVVGDAFDFDPVDSATLPSGNIVFTGGAALVNATVLAKNKVRFTVTFPETVGGFDIGNVILSMQTEDGVILPFMWFVSDVPYPKQITNGVGNRLVFHFVEEIKNIEDALTITVEPPAHWSLPQYSNDAEAPPAELGLFQQYILQTTVGNPRPALAVRRPLDNKTFGIPLSERLDSPFFGRIDGGRAGESRVEYLGRYFWGGRLNSETVNYATYGGGDLGDAPPYIIGGGVLLDNFGYGLWDGFLTGEFIWGGRLEFPTSYYLTQIGGTPLSSAPTPDQTYGGVPLAHA